MYNSMGQAQMGVLKVNSVLLRILHLGTSWKQVKESVMMQKDWPCHTVAIVVDPEYGSMFSWHKVRCNCTHKGLIHTNMGKFEKHGSFVFFYQKNAPFSIPISKDKCENDVFALYCG